MFVIIVENLRKASKCVFYIVSLVLMYIHVIGMYGFISLSIDTFITILVSTYIIALFKTSIKAENVTENHYRPKPLCFLLQTIIKIHIYVKRNVSWTIESYYKQ